MTFSFRSIFQKLRKRNDADDASYTAVKKVLSASSFDTSMPQPEFKNNLLSELKASVFSPSPETAPRKSHSGIRWDELFRSPVVAVASSAFVLVAIAVTVITMYGTPTSGPSNTNVAITGHSVPENIETAFVLNALDKDATGIHPDTDFELSTRVDVTKEEIEQGLKFTPDVEFTVVQRAGEPTAQSLSQKLVASLATPAHAETENVFSITLHEPLLADTSLHAQLRLEYATQTGTQPYDYSWTYQVQEKFQVVSTLPRNHGTHVPINTGIEFALSHVGFTGAEDAFSITPNVPGRFETHRNTFVFVPSRNLDAFTYYEVRLAKSVTLPATGETLKNDVVVGFETSGSENSYQLPQNLRLESKLVESSEHNAPILAFTNLWGEKDRIIKVETLAFPNAEQFESAFDAYNAIPTWATEARQAWTYPTNGLARTMQADLPLQDSSYRQYIEFPEKLPVGYYLVTLNSDGYKQNIALLQVTNVTSFLTTSETEFVVWTNESLSSNPLSNVRVTLSDDTFLGATDSDGVLRVPTPAVLLASSDATPTVILDNGGSRLYTSIGHEEERWTRTRDGCYEEFEFNRFEGFDSFPSARCVNGVWSYLYLDRPFYGANDTVNFFGVMESRSGEEISSVVMQYYDPENGLGKGLIHEQRVSVGEHGTFSGSMKLSGAAGFLAIVDDDHVVVSKHVEIREYDRPLYDLNISPAVIGAINGETVTHEITATLFDGTPAANVPLSSTNGPMRTDAQGKTTTRTTIDLNGRRPSSEALMVHNADAQEEELYEQAHIAKYPSSELIKVDAESSGSRATVTGTLHALDLDGYNSGKYQPYELPYGDVLTNHPVQIEVSRYWYEREQIGTSYYDFVEKKQVPEYRYTSRDGFVSTQEVRTDDNGVFSVNFEMVGDSWYTVTVVSKDAQGREVEAQTWASAYDSEYQQRDEQFYLWKDGEVRESAPKVSVGEEVRIGFYRGDAPAQPREKDRFMFLTGQEGVHDADLSRDGKFTFTFDENDIPNVVVQGVMFDGRSYWPTYTEGLAIAFQRDDRALSVDLTPKNNAYGPGDEATFEIQVKDANGAGRESVVNVSIVDEAIFALEDQRVNFLNNLYRNVRSGIYHQRGSHVGQNKDMTADGFGGGPSNARKRLVDSALFTTVKTDADGRASVTFTLPDNLTTWRITGHALSSDHYAGNGSGQIRVTRPIIVDAVMSTFYNQSDKPVIKLRTYGTELADDAAVRLTVSSESLGMAEQSFDVTGWDVIDVMLPELRPGNHTLKIEAHSGELYDGVERTFRVASSFFATPTIVRQELTNGWKPNVESSEPLELVFMDQHAGQYYEDLLRLSYAPSLRLDHRVAANMAVGLLNETFDAHRVAEEIPTEGFQHSDTGALTLYPYTDSDLMLSASVAASRGVTLFNQQELVRYFNAVLNDPSQTTLRHAQSLYGLAGLQQPVQYEIQQMLASDQITDTDRLVLALALATLGDQTAARPLYDPLMASYAETADGLTLLKLGATREEQIQNTLLAATLAAHLQDSEADALYGYVRVNRTQTMNQELVLNVEEGNYLSARLAVVPSTPVTIRYRHLGQERTATLENGTSARVILTPETRADFEVLSVDGAASVVLSFVTPYQEPAGDSRLSISRSYEKLEVSEGEAVRVTFNIAIAEDAPDGAYQVVDVIPSGFRLASYQLAYAAPSFTGNDRLRFPFEQVGPRVIFNAYKRDTSFSYVLRSSNKGTFTAEAPLLQSLTMPSVQTFGTSHDVVVK